MNHYKGEKTRCENVQLEMRWPRANKKSAESLGLAACGKCDAKSAGYATGSAL
jgi:hypothetical protein